MIFRDPLLSDLISTVKLRLDQLEEEEENNVNGYRDSKSSSSDDDDIDEESADDDLFLSSSDAENEDEDGMADADVANDCWRACCMSVWLRPIAESTPP